MNSTQDSKKSNQKLILRGRNVNFVFFAKTYKFVTVRDMIAELARDPMGTLLNESDRVHILNDLNFEINNGDRIGILGVNGAGKTTLCRCLAGLYKSRGTIETFGHKIRAVFDTSMGIQPELTGRENANLLLKFMYPEFYSEHANMLQEICDFSELKEFLDIPFKDYSNGMQARLCLSLISSKPADLLILDEVFDGADQFFRKKISIRVQDLIKHSGAVLFVSHSVDQILQICNRVWYLKDGQIIFDGPPEKGIQLYHELGQHQGLGHRFE